ncbi:MAG: shikimate dehydrogenase [Sulfobacillus acidophilus]|uniref:Shikimate dehydrogenase n=1 Tax=Sulfobacillus acidophilus TaxID=53633 RepID=A0A2T2WPN5_9FIRM|nr:MAG: shikimate dehydrogenase [Sulfobacillus acidophilus]
MQLYAVFGQPIAHSLSPVIHNEAFRSQGIAANYFAVECSPSQLQDKLRAFEVLGGCGVNLTRPLKQTVLPLLAAKSEWVDSALAANILRRDGEEWVGDNTDCEALYRLLQGLKSGLGDALVLGCGGVARATAAVLQRHGYRVVGAARRPALCGWADEAIVWDDRLKPAPWQVVVNATPLGQDDEGQEERWPTPEPGGIAVDWVYRPRATRFLQEAQAHQAIVIDGLTLLVEQAALGWRTWFGMEAPRQVMWKAVGAWQ